MIRRMLFAALGVALAATTALAQNPPQGQPGARQRDAFPHDEHAKLFPTCASCHAGIERGEPTRAFPTVQQCETCHNGRDEERVSWRPAPRPAGNLEFSHPAHQRELSPRDSVTCQTCHGTPNGRAYMDVARVRAETCFQCHTHRASAHLAEDNRCSTCHRPLVQATGFSVQQVSRLPKPPSHERADFVSAHEPKGAEGIAQCAVCHSRETCARCHVNARTNTQIASLGTDARVASLVRGKAASYPLPASHRDPEFLFAHGAQANADINGCATCHARPSCQSCHLDVTGPRVQSINRLPMPERGMAPGVRLERRVEWSAHDAPASGASGPMAQGSAVVLSDGGAVDVRGTSVTVGAQGTPVGNRRAPNDTTRRFVRVHPPGFEKTHGPAASTQQLTCSNCHAQRYCSDCHSGESKSRRYHPANFVQRHAPESWGRETDCAKCHNAQVFCRSCHVQTGLASNGRLDAAYHSAQPLWLLQHGRAARQGLQSCTTCHTQRDCMQCHSQVGWGISPHGRDFDARAMSKRAKSQCFRCHITDPLAAR